MGGTATGPARGAPAGGTHPSPLLTTCDDRLGRAHGRGEVRATTVGAVAALVARALGLPAGRPVTADLAIEPVAGGERWARRFGRRRWSTTCERTATGITEWIGPAQSHHLVGLDLDLALGVGPRPGPGGDGATLRLRSVRLGPWAIGRPLGLEVAATTSPSGDRLVFAATVTVAGRRLVAYQGWIR